MTFGRTLYAQLLRNLSCLSWQHITFTFSIRNQLTLFRSRAPYFIVWPFCSSKKKTFGKEIVLFSKYANSPLFSFCFFFLPPDFRLFHAPCRDVADQFLDPVKTALGWSHSYSDVKWCYRIVLLCFPIAHWLWLSTRIFVYSIIMQFCFSTYQCNSLGTTPSRMNVNFVPEHHTLCLGCSRALRKFSCLLSTIAYVIQHVISFFVYFDP